MSGSDKSAWKNPRPWIKKKSDDKQGIETLIRGKVGRSLVRSTVRLATARAKVEKRKIMIDVEPSSSSDQEKLKKSTKKVGCGFVQFATTKGALSKVNKIKKIFRQYIYHLTQKRPKLVEGGIL